MVIGRILRAVLGVRSSVNDVLWRLLLFAAALLGIVLMVAQRLRSGMVGGSRNQKAIWFAGAFLVLTSVVTLIGDRASAHIWSSKLAKPQEPRARAQAA